MDHWLSRAQHVLGQDKINALARAKIIIFGVGGVGSWCAESLVRTGAMHLTLVDFDRVACSNINRQMMATQFTIGEVKVDAIRNRLLEINPECEIIAIDKAFNEETAGDFLLDGFDFIIDCIDSIKDKALLIEMATRTKATLLSSMGAARKLDPSHIKTGEFWSVKGCPLARALRNRFKKSNRFPAKKFQCVYSDEQWNGDSTEKGSLMHITAIFGLTLTSLLIRKLS